MSHFVLELFFDADTDQKVRDIWRLLDDLPDWSAPARGESRPHISVASTMELDVDGFDSALQCIAKRTAALPISFASIGVFPIESGVVFLAPIVTVELLRLHAALFSELQRCGATVSDLYGPGNWAPHCTLAMPLPAEVAARAVKVVASQNFLLKGRIESVGVVRVSSEGSKLGAVYNLAGGL